MKQEIMKQEIRKIKEIDPEEIKALKYLWNFTEDVLPQVGKLVIQDISGLNNGYTLTRKILDEYDKTHRTKKNAPRDA